MTAQDRTTLKSKFEQGDTPQGTDYEDLIDSALNVADTSAQSVTSHLFTPELQATHVSAGSITVTQTVSASTASFDNLFEGGGRVHSHKNKATGVMYVTATAATSIGSSGTYELVNGTFSAAAINNMSAQANGTLIYTATTTARVHMCLSYTITAASGSTTTAIRLARNSTTIPHSEMERHFVVGTERGASSTQALTTAAPSDVFGVYVANLSNDANLTIEKMVFSVQEL